MKKYLFKNELVINKPINTVFSFFSRAENLNTITPPWLNFKILTPEPIMMKAGTLIEYRLRIHRFPASWKSEITEWNPPYKFTDSQIKGPYRLWVHEHIFNEEAGGTRIIDRVQYAVPGWFLAPIIHELVVRNDIQTIFNYRNRKLFEIFENT